MATMMATMLVMELQAEIHASAGCRVIANRPNPAMMKTDVAFLNPEFMKASPEMSSAMEARLISQAGMKGRNTLARCSSAMLTAPILNISAIARPVFGMHPAAGTSCA